MIQSDFEKFGYTSNCRRCTYTCQGRSTHGMAHNQQCRDRMESKLRDEGDPRILRAEARSNQEIARRLGEAPAPQEEEKGMGSDDLPQPQGGPKTFRPYPDGVRFKDPPSDDVKDAEIHFSDVQEEAFRVKEQYYHSRRDNHDDDHQWIRIAMTVSVYSQKMIVRIWR